MVGYCLSLLGAAPERWEEGEGEGGREGGMVSYFSSGWGVDICHQDRLALVHNWIREIRNQRDRYVDHQ